MDGEVCTRLFGMGAAAAALMFLRVMGRLFECEEVSYNVAESAWLAISLRKTVQPYRCILVVAVPYRSSVFDTDQI